MMRRRSTVMNQSMRSSSYASNLDNPSDAILNAANENGNTLLESTDIVAPKIKGVLSSSTVTKESAYSESNQNLRGDRELTALHLARNENQELFSRFSESKGLRPSETAAEVYMIFELPLVMPFMLISVVCIFETRL